MSSSESVEYVNEATNDFTKVVLHVKSYNQRPVLCLKCLDFHCDVHDSFSDLKIRKNDDKNEHFVTPILASFWKPEARGQTVLPDRTKIGGKCDILSDFQTMCVFGTPFNTYI